MTWDVTPNTLVEGFIIFRSEGSAAKMKRINNIPLEKGQRLFIDKDIEPGKEYFYTMSCIARDDVIGENSAIVSVSLSMPRPPSIQNLRIYKTKGGYIISWDYVASYDHFEIEAIRIRDNRRIKLGKTKDKQYLFKDNGKEAYKIFVRARRGKALSAFGEFKRIEGQ